MVVGVQTLYDALGALKQSVCWLWKTALFSCFSSKNVCKRFACHDCRGHVLEQIERLWCVRFVCILVRNCVLVVHADQCRCKLAGDEIEQCAHVNILDTDKLIQRVDND